VSAEQPPCLHTAVVERYPRPHNIACALAAANVEDLPLPVVNLGLSFADKTWRILESAIREIHNQNASGLSFEELYRSVNKGISSHQQQE